MGIPIQITAEEAAAMVKDGMSVMIGGFMTNGTPKKLVDALVASGVKDLTVICNDGGLPGIGTEKLIANHQVKKLIATHVGLTPEVGRQYSAGELELELIPQGTFAERIRCGGFGLGGFLTPTGVGTVIEEGKQKMEINGKTYLLELPMRADVALIGAYICDRGGNVRYRGSMRNFNVVMATAADCVIVECERLVEVDDDDLHPEFVETSGVFVDYIVEGGKY